FYQRFYLGYQRFSSFISDSTWVISDFRLLSAILPGLSAISDFLSAILPGLSAIPSVFQKNTKLHFYQCSF
ncbi:hypothetical protein, partial [Lysinibacillus agricola]|uniref:hypothetical protein n=1 Tax=Lysinibacillus agricola TaxID=2590012 RepID=UPI003C1DFDB2